MILGFTGSRQGLSDFQKTEIEKFISVNAHEITESHRMFFNLLLKGEESDY